MRHRLSFIYHCLRDLIMSMLNKNRVLKRPALEDGSLLRSTKLAAVDGEPPVKKKVHAILMMYCGWGYYGMQRTPTHPTIEGELSKALLACGYLADFTGEAYRKVWFQRASKTDKAVSAIGQVCSMLLPEDENITEELNSVLPEHIRILDVIRATRSFSANTACSHRVYDYLLPTFALAPRDFTIDDSVYRSFRVSATTLTHANVVLKRFKGTHNFYNFTSGRLPTDGSCNRYIISIECLPPFLYEDCQYCVVRVVGQSFMLHQIRKMIGLMIAIVRGNATEDVFDCVFGTERVDIPKAPGLGLMLSEVNYDRYNARFGEDGFHNPIVWSKYEKQMDEFKMNYIYKHIHEKEIEERSMIDWLSSLDVHTYGYRVPSSPIPLQAAEVNPSPVASHEPIASLPVTTEVVPVSTLSS
ncbi:hypothetical protein CRM22_008496 [Opisthorchis felineus]|uniref:Pseudouridylate synthase 1 homolog n=1 Tax=Opisthorchis felineus TaxID=147828 RepID=A0A4S2LBN6_OPIFE|nr:hypothetical protein CRM22_008496 [Opisthorchis felineus]